MKKAVTKRLVGGIVLSAMILSLASCGDAGEPSATPAAGLFRAGTYTASADGQNGPVTVEVTFSDEEITAVTVTEHQETPGISDPAIEELPKAIQEAQSTQIDGISGATVTSGAILAAVEDAITQAGGDPASLTPREREETPLQEETLTADVVVVGGGLTGVSAALSAAQNGASVILIEKMSALGGSSGISGGGLAAGGTSLQAQAGIKDSPEAYAKTLIDDQITSPNPSIYPDVEKVNWLAENAPKTIQWMVDMGYQFAEPRGHGHGVARIHFPAEGMGSAVINFFADQLNQAEVPIYLGTKGTKLIQDETGAVVGVEAVSPDTHYTIHAKSTILATGGYAQNQELIAELIPSLTDFSGYTTAAAGSTGDGITMAREAGAALYEDQWLHPSYVLPVISEVRGDVYMGTHYYMLINDDGTRFADEDADFPIVYNAAVQTPGKKYMVFDSGEVFASYVTAADSYTQEQGVFKADTVEELASLIGADKLPETVAAYGHGNDPFGKAADIAPALETGPFYAVEAHPFNMGTFGGVKTNLDCQVLDGDGNVISGLYAGGEMSNRAFFNQVYIGGSATQCAATMGRIAGEKAANDR